MAEKRNNDDELGALWLKNNNGKKYYSGMIKVGGETINVVVFPNGFKEEGSNAPDFRILKSKPRDGEGSTKTAEKPAEGKKSDPFDMGGDKPAGKKKPAAPADDDDDIPF